MHSHYKWIQFSHIPFLAADTGTILELLTSLLPVTPDDDCTETDEFVYNN